MKSYFQEKFTSLPRGCILRLAKPNEMPAIKKLIDAEKFDPTRLHCSRFWVIEFEEKLIAFGRLCNLNNAQELASLFVVPEWRHQGIRTYLAQYLIEQASQPLYLKCRADKLVPFYSRLGFVPVPWQILPMALKWEFGLTEIVKRLLRLPLITMQYSARV